MTRFTRSFSVLGLVALTGALYFGLGSASTLLAQIGGGTIVQQHAQHLDAATSVSTSATTATTITLTPNASESVYVYEVDIANCAGASAVTAAAPTTITTTNLAGSPAYTIASGVTAGLCTQSYSLEYPTGLKAATTGTAVTYVLPTFATNQTIRVNVAWRSAQ